MPLTLLTLYLLCFFELPLWCNPSHVPKWKLAKHPCRAPDPTSQIYLSDLPYLPPMVTVVIEITCYLVILAIMALDTRWRGMADFCKQIDLVTYAVLATAGIADSVFYMLEWQNTFRIAPYCRIALIANTEPLRSTFM